MMAGEMLVTRLNLADPAQRDAADGFVMAHPQGTPFHRPAWLTGVERGTGNRAHMLAAVAPSGEIAGLLPLHHVRSALFGDRKSVVSGKSGSVRVDLGGCRVIKKKKKK